MEHIARTIFWSSFGVTTFIYFIYPLIICLIAKTIGRKPKKDDITPFVSLVIALYNEEDVIKDKIANLFHLDYPKDKLEVIFALDGCTDRTKEII